MKRRIVLALAGALVSCGGGGDGDGSGGGYDVNAAFTTLFTQGASFPGLRGTVVQGGAQLTESHTWEPLASVAENLAVLHTTTTIPSGTAVTPASRKETLFFNINPLTLLATQNDAGLLHYARDGVMPSNAKPGERGALGHAIDGGSSQQVMWELGASDTPGLAWACMYFILASGQGSSQGTCLKIDPQGRFYAARVEYHSLAFEAVLQ